MQGNKMHRQQATNINRRRFLKGAGAAALSAASYGTMSTAMSHFARAQAQSVGGGYKAIVGLFLFGGMDNFDTVIPFDQASYDNYRRERRSLIDRYADGSRDRNNLLPLNPVNAGDFGSNQFALPRQLPNLHSLFEAGNASIVANVGPLIEPTTRDQFEAEVRIPARLFSHNDQQSTWAAFAPEGARLGWGGSFGDAVVRQGANSEPAFTTLSADGQQLFLAGDQTAPYRLSSGGRTGFNLLRRFAKQDNDTAREITDALRAIYRSDNFDGDNLIQRDMVNASNSSLTNNALYSEALENLAPIGVEFPDSRIGGQLARVADAIAIRDTLGANRQVFFAGMGGWDTHSNQAVEIPLLHGELDAAIGAFFAAMQALGLENDVALFTMSDFGRSLNVNGDGTDHGWGGHHFVVGGGVRGNRIFGDIPPPVDDHSLDAGRGRLIPTIAVDQYAAGLGQFFGLGQDDLDSALPNLRNFEDGPLPLF